MRSEEGGEDEEREQEQEEQEHRRRPRLVSGVQGCYVVFTTQIISVQGGLEFFAFTGARDVGSV